MAATDDYTKQIHISATPEKVSGTLTTVCRERDWRLRCRRSR